MESYERCKRCNNFYNKCKSEFNGAWTSYSANIEGIEVCNNCLHDYHDMINTAKRVWRFRI